MIRPPPTPASKEPIMGTLDMIGVWDVPGLAGRQTGRLACDKNRKTLTVMAFVDTATALEKGFDPTLETVPAIRGVIETGEHVLLDECAAIGREFATHTSEPRTDHDGGKTPGVASSIMRATYRAKSMYVSRAPLTERPKSSRISVSYTSLFTWLNHYSIDADIGEERATFTFVPPKPRKVALSDDLSLTLSYGHTISGGVPQKDFVLPQSASVIFESASQACIDWFYPRIRTFANFLMMGTRFPVQPEAYTMEPGGRDEIAVFPEYRLYENFRGDEDLFGMHFDYQEIAGSFDGAIRHWFDMAERYDRSMGLYFQTRLGDVKDSDILLLRQVQALEAFYRARHPAAKTKSLRCMLEELVRDLPYGIFPDGQAEHDFLSGAAGARNYFSHGYLPGKEGSIPEGGDLVKMTARAELLLYGCFLHELGIGDSLKESVMRKEANWVDSLNVY